MCVCAFVLTFVLGCFCLSSLWDEESEVLRMMRLAVLGVLPDRFLLAGIQVTEEAVPARYKRLFSVIATCITHYAQEVLL